MRVYWCLCVHARVRICVNVRACVRACVRALLEVGAGLVRQSALMLQLGEVSPSVHLDLVKQGSKRGQTEAVHGVSSHALRERLGLVYDYKTCGKCYPP